MTIFGPFSKDTDYSVERINNEWSISASMISIGWWPALTASGIALETRNEWNSEAGRFARIHEPEGN